MSDISPIITDPTGPGDIKPYGPPIREAVASGDTTQMQIQADNAYRWLAANPGDPNAEDVRLALAELDAALKSI